MAKKEDKQAAKPADGARPKMTPEQAKAILDGSHRTHSEALGMPWAVLLGGNPKDLMNQVVATVLTEGGTRPAWRWTVKGTEFVLMAWPREEPVRAAVLMGGEEGKQLKAVDAFPLLQGLPNDLVVADVHPWKAGHGANVAATMIEGSNPMWFYDPLYERDHDDLTPDVKQTFLLAGLAFSVRKALLDEISITQGPAFEHHAEEWLKANPGRGRLDVPPLRISLVGRYIIMPGRQFDEYQVRARLERVEDSKLDKMEVKILYASFPFDNRPSMQLPIYCSRAVLKDYEPKAGDEIDAYLWLQGRVIDMDEAQQAEAEQAAGTAAAQDVNLGVVPAHKNPLQ